MTHKELLEEFLVFEDHNKLFDLQIEEFPIWEYLRFDIFHLLKAKLVAEKYSVSLKRSSKLKKLFSGFLGNIIFKNPYRIKKNVDLLIFNHPRRRQVKDLYHDIHTDPFLPDLNLDYAVIESVFNWNHLKPAATSNLYYFDAIEVPSMFARLKMWKEPSENDIKKIDRLFELAYKQWGVSIEELRNSIYRYMRQYNYMYPRVEKLLKKVKPKKILNVVSYIFNNQIVTEVAHRLNIEVVEVQHGIAGKLHIGYNYKGNPDLKTVPDYFLAWGSYWIRDTRMAIPMEKRIIVGYPYLDNYRKEIEVVKDEKKIIVLSQMSDEIGKFAQLLATKLPEYTIIFKAHPTEYTIVHDKYTYLMNTKNILVINNDRVPLYTLFQESKYVMGVNSTAMIEALGFGNSVFVVKLPGWEYFENMVDNNCFILADSVEEAIKSIGTVEHYTKNQDINEYFAKDALAKTCGFLER